MKKYYVYVIKSIEGYHYIGMTEDLDNRLKQHNDKSLSFWTKRIGRSARRGVRVSMLEQASQGQLKALPLQLPLQTQGVASLSPEQIFQANALPMP